MADARNVELSELLASYVRGSTPERNALAAQYSQIFTEEVVVSLREASALLITTRAEASEAVEAVEAVDAELDLPQEGSLTKLPAEERRQLMDPEEYIKLFSRSLAGLLQQRERQTAGCCDGQELRTLATQRRDTEPVALPWHQTPVLALRILSFLSIEEVFLTSENVCRAWRYWLYQPEFSKYFWIEAVQREYPEALGQLISLHGSDIMTSDWRDIAMTMCSGVLDDNEENQDSEENEEDV